MAEIVISVLLSRPQHLAQLQHQGQDTFGQSQEVALFYSRFQVPKGEADSDIQRGKIMRLTPPACNKRTQSSGGLAWPGRREEEGTQGFGATV